MWLKAFNLCPDYLRVDQTGVSIGLLTLPTLPNVNRWPGENLLCPFSKQESKTTTRSLKK